MLLSTLVAFAITACSVVAAPLLETTALVSRAFAANAGDAPFSLSQEEYSSRIVCPNGIKGAVGGIVFLVHGTAITGRETWGTGPFVTILPNKGPQYDVCYIEIPQRSLNDAQMNAEYVAAAIQILAPQSKAGGKLFIIGHSQGNINIQWALLYWPSLRNLVSGFSALAGDFKGTAEGPLLCIPLQILQGGCEPSVIQQTVGSNYLAAQNKRGLQALVPTVSIYTIQDDIIQPEIIDPTSILPGASSVSVQELCGITYLADHFTIPYASPAFYLTYLALTEGANNARSKFSLDMCTYFTADTVVPNPFTQAASALRLVFAGAVAAATDVPRVRKEPALETFVCAAGDATECSNSS